MISVDSASTDSLCCILAREGRTKITVSLTMHDVNLKNYRESLMKPLLLSRNKCVQAEGEDAIMSEAQLLLDCFLRVHYFVESFPLFIRIVTVSMI